MFIFDYMILILYPNILEIGDHVYIGGSRAEDNTWVWSSSGSQIDTFYWSQAGVGGQPNNFNGNQDCLGLSGGSGHGGLWNDVSCFVSFSYICEFIN